MLDIGWQELMVIGALALIVVGPKDLPGLLRSVGQWVGRARSMARDFQRAMNDAAREADIANLSEVRDLKRDLGKQMDFTDMAAKGQSFLDKTPSDKTAADKTSSDKTLTDTAPATPSASPSDSGQTAAASSAAPGGDTPPAAGASDPATTAAKT